MSETPRSYTPRGGPGGFSRRRGRGLGSTIRIVGAVVGVFLVLVVWVSRDTHPIHEFIASDQKIQIVAPKAMKHRERVAQAPLWSSVPGLPLLISIRELLEDDFGFPEWMLRNLVGGDVIVTGNDTERLSDLLFMTKMTTVGCVVQRMNRLRPGIAEDWAGGLRLRRLVGSDIWYTVRGRTLIASASRDSLVNALTLTPEARADPESLEGLLSGDPSQNARATIRLDPDERLGRVFESLSFSLRVDDSGNSTLAFRSEFREEWREKLAVTLRQTAPTELRAPFDGPIAISGDFGIPVKDLWVTIGELLDNDNMSEERWESWETGDGEAPIAEALASILGPAGPAFSMTWLGIDLNEVAPTPMILGTVNAEKARVVEILEGLPRAPDSAAYMDTYAYYDPDLKRMHAPIMSGPSMEPTAAWHGDELLFSTSRLLAEVRLAESPVQRTPLPRRANLYVNVQPQTCMRILARAGQELADEGLLRNYTAEEFREVSAAWVEEASKVEQATFWLTVNNEAAVVELFVSPSRVPAPID